MLIGVLQWLGLSIQLEFECFLRQLATERSLLNHLPRHVGIRVTVLRPAVLDLVKLLGHRLLLVLLLVVVELGRNRVAGCHVIFTDS